ncbi:MAG: M28 family peptidase [Planctomycetia bacterium]|nr:M28 family peptidase [Planctomycetia bacterium]
MAAWIFAPRPTGAPYADAQETQVAQRAEFAQDRNLPKALNVSPAAFDADRAMKYLKEVCDIGPRMSGSEGMKKQQALMQKHFEALGGKVEYQRFKANQKSVKQPIEMANMIVSYWPERTRRVIFCCHYDTRPLADQEEDPRKWREPFVSANDGGSGVAFLMEMAHHIKDLNINVGVDFVFFDGEEYILEPGTDKYFFGSEYFAAAYKNGRQKHKYLGAILLDMIAGKGARFPRDPNSVLLAGPLVDSVWKVAAEFKCNSFVHRDGTIVVDDDHVPLNRGGIPAIDIIDFSYKHWHKLSDTPDNCAPEPMAEVAKVLTVWVQRVK